MKLLICNLNLKEISEKSKVFKNYRLKQKESQKLKPTFHKSLLSLNKIFKLSATLENQKPNFQEIIISVSWDFDENLKNGLKKLSSAGQGDEKPEKIVEQHFIISNIFGFIILSPNISKKIFAKI
jgi:hypothetical protein